MKIMYLSQLQSDKNVYLIKLVSMQKTNSVENENMCLTNNLYYGTASCWIV
jgi:hypothetical protein